ncbi:RP1 [Symbiodinium necroappetens]|uniref:RP1 protein n=1 Tax=Symbiodinium necroappetens TaxID=1628268 RepID=A0A813CED7_9DINO|nr:RP1 [Symbiodinium necroappetens]
MLRSLLLCLPISVSLEATSLEGSSRRDASLAVAISADGAAQGLVRRQRWWAPRAPPDESRPQPLANTGTINPLSCYDTLVKAKIPCVNFAKVVCKPWQAEECQCDEKNPICVTDAAQRSSPASPANGRSAIATQHACCPKPAPDEAE